MAETTHSEVIENVSAGSSYDHLTVEITIKVSGRRNLPNAQNLGKAFDAAKDVGLKVLANTYIKDETAREMAQEAVKLETRELVATPMPAQPAPVSNPSSALAASDPPPF